MTSFLSTIKINNYNIVYKELKLKDYKTILKCLVSEPIDEVQLFLNLNYILKQITNLTQEQIESLNLLEYLLLLVNIRITSVGSSIFGTYKTEEESINVEIPLYKTIEELEKCLKTFNNTNYKDNNITLTTTVPQITDILNKKTTLHIKEEIDNLPLKYLKQINLLTNNYNLFFNKHYFYKSPIEKFSIKINLDKNNFCNLIKTLFNDDLLNVYDNIYYLCKFSQLTPEYLENCTYGEFKIYVKKTEELLYKNTKPVIDSVEEPQYDPVDISSLYGNNESQITRSEFTP